MNLENYTKNKHVSFWRPQWKLQFLDNEIPRGCKQRCSVKEEIFARKSCPFYWQRIQKAIHTRSQLKNKFFKNPTQANELLLKNQWNKYVLLRKKCIKNYFSKVTESGVNTNKEFWKYLNLFLQIRVFFQVMKFFQTYKVKSSK